MSLNKAAMKELSMRGILLHACLALTTVVVSASASYAQLRSFTDGIGFDVAEFAGTNSTLSPQDCPFPDSVAVPDTLDPAGYYPTGAGWIWDYVTVDGPFLDGANRLATLGDTLVDDIVFSIIDKTDFFFPNPVKREMVPTLHVRRYVSATDSTLIYLNPVNGTQSVNPVLFGAPFDSCDQTGTEISGGYGVTFVTTEEGSLVTHEAAAIKTFDYGLPGRETYAHGIGFVYGSYEVNSERMLAYVRSGNGEEIGVPLDQQFVITSVSEPELPSETSLSVYPNPTRGRILIDVKTEKASVLKFVVTDVIGRKLDQVITFSSSGSTRIEYSMHGRPSGFYVLTVHPDHGLPLSATIILEP